MLIYYINLDRSHDRKQSMEKQFQLFGLDVTRLSAIDGSTLNLTDYKSCGLTPGEIGCYLSHIKAWKLLLETDDQFAVIFEDDIKISADFNDFLNNTQWRNEIFDIIKLDTSQRRVFLSKTGKRLKPKRSLFRLLTPHLGTAGYIIHRSFAEKLIRDHEIIEDPIDVVLFDQKGLSENTILQIEPALVIQPIFLKDMPHFESILRPQRTERRKNQPKPSLLRKAMGKIQRPSMKIAKYVFPYFRHGLSYKWRPVFFE